jgi:hypothetical protein
MSNTPSTAWPELPFDQWKETCETLHMWLQVVGKIRLKLSPYVNHWWEVPLYVSTRGLRTSPIPYENKIFEIEFDFNAHILVIRTSDSQYRAMPLTPRPVADFYQELLEHLGSLDIDVRIDIIPKEVPNAIPFDRDYQHQSYDRSAAHRFWLALVHGERVLSRFRAGFIGKSSPVHFFWGSMDLAVSRFSGRRAPERPLADHITRLAYSHEVISCGFWPGSNAFPEAAYYAYAAPEPAGFTDTRLTHPDAFYNLTTRGFILPYARVRESKDPEREILTFCQETYEAAATLGHWDRQALERRTPEFPQQAA